MSSRAMRPVRPWHLEGVSRREFVAIGIVAAGAAMTPLGMGQFHALAGGTAMPRSLAELRLEDFVVHLGEAFRVEHPAGEAGLVLIAADQLHQQGAARATNRGPRLDGFRVLFRGANARALGQGTYRFTHQRMGTFPLFVVPGPAVHGHVRYEAVFNRLIG